MFAVTRRGRHAINVWPAFVDALASLLLVFVFIVLVFVLGQVVLTDMLSGRNRALDQLTQQVNALADTLSLERAQGAELRSKIETLSAQLSAAMQARDEAAEKLRSAITRAETAESESGQLRSQVEEASRLVETQKGRVETLTEQVAALREQLAKLSAALDLSEQKVKSQKTQIAELGNRLNVALARKVDELQRYRSEFFGRLREVLGNNPNIRIVGDRFVFQSELLFPTASAELVPEGQKQLARLAQTLKTVTRKIPPGIEWVLRIDGHTDRRPIHNAQFSSNWELSTARSLSVVDFLVDQGIPPKRLAAAGFGEYQPIDKADTPQAWARNRRIEIKLTQP